MRKEKESKMPIRVARVLCATVKRTKNLNTLHPFDLLSCPLLSIFYVCICIQDSSLNSVTQVINDVNIFSPFFLSLSPDFCMRSRLSPRSSSSSTTSFALPPFARHNSRTGIKQYLCTTCNYNGVTQSDLNRHCKTRSHILRSANVCPLCSLGFSTRILLQDHMDKFHESNPSDSSPPPAPSSACDLSVKSNLHREIITADDSSITA